MYYVFVYCEFTLLIPLIDRLARHTPYTLPDNGKYYGGGDVVEVSGLRFEVIATPGHTRGGVTLRCGNALFTGDTLFKGSCGRTDLPGGDMDEELDSLRTICSLPGDYEVYPGHMDSSTLSRERLFNYYCRLAMNRCSTPPKKKSRWRTCARCSWPWPRTSA